MPALPRAASRSSTISPRKASLRTARTYAAAVQALLEDGPIQGKTVEVEVVEGRPPKTIDVPDEKGGACQ